MKYLSKFFIQTLFAAAVLLPIFLVGYESGHGGYRGNAGMHGDHYNQGAYDYRGDYGYQGTYGGGNYYGNQYINPYPSYGSEPGMSDDSDALYQSYLQHDTNGY